MSENLYTALSNANQQLKNPVKDGRGNYGSYLTLDDLLDTLRPVYAEQGLSITQDVVCEGDRVQVVTQIHHESGESIVFGPLSWPAGDNVQKLGSAMTYLRRYALAAACGLAGAEDDDGQAHADANPKAVHTNPRMHDANGRASEKQVGMLVRLMREQHVNEVTLNEFTTQRLGFEVPADGIAHLTKGQASRLIDAMVGSEKPVQRVKQAATDPDPFADLPTVDPKTGEIA